MDLALKKTCIDCKKEISLIAIRCKSCAKKGKLNPFWRLGHSIETKQKMKSHKGSERWNWKGDKAGYKSIHHWIRKELGKANHCEECGLDKSDKQKYFNWANISHKYRRDLKDYKQLCMPCHRRFDKK